LTSGESVSEEYLFVILLSSGTMLSFWGLSKKMFQEFLLCWSETNNEGEEWLIIEQLWKINSSLFSLSFGHEEF